MNNFVLYDFHFHKHLKWRLYIICINTLELCIKSTSHFCNIFLNSKKVSKIIEISQWAHIQLSCFLKMVSNVDKMLSNHLGNVNKSFFQSNGWIHKTFIMKSCQKRLEKIIKIKVPFSVKMISMFIYILASFSWSIWAMC